MKVDMTLNKETKPNLLICLAFSQIVQNFEDEKRLKLSGKGCNLLSFSLKCSGRLYEWGIELTCKGLLVELTNHYTTEGAPRGKTPP